MTTSIERAFTDTARRLPTLFELDTQSEWLLAVSDDGDEEAADTLALLEDLIATKVENYVGVIRTLETMAELRILYGVFIGATLMLVWILWILGRKMRA